MPHPRKKKKSKDRSADHSALAGFLLNRLNEGFMIALIATAFFLLLALVTYHPNDPSWSHLVETSQIQNAAGRSGAWLADLLLYLLGYLAYVLPLMLLYSAWLLVERRRETPSSPSEPYFQSIVMSLRLFGFFLTVIAGAGLAGHKGGILGSGMSAAMTRAFNPTGGSLILVALLLTGVTLFTRLSWVHSSECLGRWLISQWRNVWQNRTEKKAESPPVAMPSPPSPPTPAPTLALMAKSVKIKPKVTVEPEDVSKEMHKAPRYSSSEILPDLSLLDSTYTDNSKKYKASEQELMHLSRQVEVHLADFGVTVQVVGVQPGPVVTRFELQLAAGTKVSKISNLAKDLARSLSVISVRVVEVIPGKSVIGLELPNKDRESVGLQEVLASKAYANSRSALTLALGKDIAGHPVVVDLAKMPHLLVAGTTGSGKSVSLNVMLLSLLYKSTPQQLRMIMIDPKMLELSVYDGVPHLLTPVVTDMRDAASALRWCVVEMERRYRLMSALGVRNIAGYNQKVREAVERGAPLLDPLPRADDQEQKALQELPQIVVLADEFADMMVVVGKKVETLIARLAQKARAAGVHLILATQRPSVDVITGLIKANIPTRIAFQVSSKIDSRTILDQQGAEQLLGNGDMLYLAPGTGVPVRVHGAYVSDDEVHRVVADLKKKGKPDYIEEILQDISTLDNGDPSEDAMGAVGDAEQDALYDQAVEMVAKTRKVSISSIQRRFKIGYNRAARIVEAMENSGVVSRMEQNGTREVLVPTAVE